MKERETALQNLEEGYQNYKILSNNFKEGIKVNVKNQYLLY